MIVIQKRVPLMLLKETKSDTLNLRAVRAAVISLRKSVIDVIVAALIFIIFLKRVTRRAFLLRLLISNLGLFGLITRGWNVMMLLLALTSVAL